VRVGHAGAAALADVIGQTTAVLVVYSGLDFELPILACLAVIAAGGRGSTWRCACASA